jgi:hypothetical protein
MMGRLLIKININIFCSKSSSIHFIQSGRTCTRCVHCNYIWASILYAWRGEAVSRLVSMGNCVASQITGQRAAAHAASSRVDNRRIKQQWRCFVRRVATIMRKAIPGRLMARDPWRPVCAPPLQSRPNAPTLNALFGLGSSSSRLQVVALAVRTSALNNSWSGAHLIVSLKMIYASAPRAVHHEFCTVRLVNPHPFKPLRCSACSAPFIKATVILNNLQLLSLSSRAQQRAGNNSKQCVRWETPLTAPNLPLS